jgi:hypothetical protein
VKEREREPETGGREREMGGSFSREKLILIFVARHTQQRQKIKLHHFLSFLSLSLSNPLQNKKEKKIILR